MKQMEETDVLISDKSPIALLYKPRKYQAKKKRKKLYYTQNCFSLKYINVNIMLQYIWPCSFSQPQNLTFPAKKGKIWDFLFSLFVSTKKKCVCQLVQTDRNAKKSSK